MSVGKTKWGTRESSILFFVEEGRYPEALSLLASIDRPLEPRLLLAKCECLYHKGMIAQAIEITKKAEKNGWDLPEFYTIKGKCLYRISEFETAKAAFEKSDSLRPDTDVRRWIQSCIARIAASGDEIMSRRVIRHEPLIMQAMIPMKLNHEWYQTATHLTLSIFFKGLSQSQIHVMPVVNKVTVVFDIVPPVQFSVTLAKEIVPTDYHVTVTPKKVEIKLKKATNVAGQWQEIEVPE